MKIKSNRLIILVVGLFALFFASTPFFGNLNFDKDNVNALSVWDGTATVESSWGDLFNVGNGASEQNAYLIQDVNMFATFAAMVNSGVSTMATWFELDTGIDGIDLNGSSHAWTAIGTAANPFQGYFNGNDILIENLVINSATGEDSFGLFGEINGATISNVRVSGFNIEVQNVQGKNAGFIAGRAINSTVENCAVNVSRAGAYENAGGIVGVGSGLYIGTSNVVSSSLSSNQLCGGIVGSIAVGMGTSSIVDCSAIYNTVFSQTVIYRDGVYSVSGGIVGKVYNATISGCASGGNNVFAGTYAGGVAGQGYAVQISNSYNTSGVVGTDGESFGGKTGQSGGKGTDGIDGTAAVDYREDNGNYIEGAVATKGTNGGVGGNGDNGMNGRSGGTSGGIIAFVAGYDSVGSSLTNCFNAGQINGGSGGDGGNGGAGGNGGNGGNGGAASTQFIAGLGGNGGNGGIGGNAGNGGDAGFVGAIYGRTLKDGTTLVVTNSYANANLTAQGIAGVRGVAGQGGNGGQGGTGSTNGATGGTGKSGGEGRDGEGAGRITVVGNYAEVATPTVRFTVNGADENLIGANSISCAFNAALGVLPTASKAGYTFVGWKEQTSGVMVSQKTSYLWTSLETVLVPVFDTDNNVTVNVHANGTGATVNTQSIVMDGHLYLLPQLETLNPQRAGYSFDGWYTHPTNFVEENQVIKFTRAGEVTDVYAKWIQNFKITFQYDSEFAVLDYNDGSLNPDMTLTVAQGRVIGYLPTAQPKNVSGATRYFGGWYIVDGTGDEFAQDKLVSYVMVYTYNRDITVKARYLTNAYLEYNLMGATGIDECSAPWDGGTEAFAGSGTESAPYLISNARQLARMRDLINSGNQSTYNTNARYYLLTNNIDLANIAWLPMGTATNTFKANFDGNGFYVKNLYVSNATNGVAGGTLVTASTTFSARYEYNMGFFGVLGDNAKLKRFGLESGKVEAKFENYTFSTARENYFHVGSIAGITGVSRNSSSGVGIVMEQCYSNVDVTIDINNSGQSSAVGIEIFCGGIVGMLNGRTVLTDCYNGGNVTSSVVYKNHGGSNTLKTYNFVGGIVGMVYSATFTNVFNTKPVVIVTDLRRSSTTSPATSTIAFAGGICGEIQGGGTLTNCFNTALISATGTSTGSSSNAGDRRVEVGGVVAHFNNGTGAAIRVNGCKNTAVLECISRRTSNATADSGYTNDNAGRNIGGILGLITHAANSASTAVTGTKNHYKTPTPATTYSGIGYYTGTGISNIDKLPTSGTSTYLNFVTTSSTHEYGVGDFEFTSPDYFMNATYFDTATTSWDFADTWEFRLDRNDNLPMLKYMCYETNWLPELMTVDVNRKHVYYGQKIGRLITPVRTGFTFEGWYDREVYFDPELGEMNTAGATKYVGKDATALFGVNNPNETTFLSSGNIVIYAAWKPVDLYDIQFYERDAATVSRTLQGWYDYEMTMVYTPTRDGYTFAGWYNENDILVTNSTLLYQKSTIKLYARWQSNEYTIRLSGDCYLSNDAVYVTYDTRVGSLPSPYKAGYTFLGWYLGNTQVTENTVYNFTNDIELVARWSDANTYAVKFNANGATGNMPNQSFTFGASAALDENRFSMEGYDFVGWALTATSDVVYADRATYSFLTEGDKELFAVWQAQKYTVVMQSNNADSNFDRLLIDEVEVGTQFYDLPILTRAGYEFMGWYFDAGFATRVSALTDEGVKTDIIALGGRPVDESIIVYAKWAINTYTIKFDKNQGSGSTVDGTASDQVIVFDLTTNTLNTAVYTRVGYDFLGWATYDTATAPQYTGGATLDKTLLDNYAVSARTLTLFAVWRANSYTVQFNNNVDGLPLDGNNPRQINGTMASQTFSFETAQRLGVNQFAVAGFEFMGWSTTPTAMLQPNTTTTVIANNSMFTITSDFVGDGTTVNLYAVWRKVEYKIYFSGGAGVEGGLPSTTLVFEAAGGLTLPTATEVQGVITRSSYYSFGGWSFEQFSTATTADIAGGGVLFADIETVSKWATGNQIFMYVYWIPTQYSVEFDANFAGAGDLLANDFTIGYGENKDLPDTLAGGNVRPYYTFVGWSYTRMPDGATPDIEYGLKLYMTEQGALGYLDGNVLKLYAVWRAVLPDVRGVNIGGQDYLITNGSVPVQYKIALDGARVLVGAGSGNYNFEITGQSHGLTISGTGVLGGSFADIGLKTITVVVTDQTTGAISGATISFEVGRRVVAVNINESDLTSVYSGTQQSLAYQTSGIDGADTCTVNVEYGGETINVGTYSATFTLDGVDSINYEFANGQSNMSVNFEITKATLTVTGKSVSREYGMVNDGLDYKGFTSVTGFCGTDSISLINMAAVTFTPTAGQYGNIGNHDILISGITLENYTVEYAYGKLEITAAQFTGTVVIAIDAVGYVEGSKIHATVTAPGYDVGDYQIIWEYATSPNGTFTQIAGEHGDTLILTEYRLGFDVKNLYYRARVVGAGNYYTANGVTTNISNVTAEKITATAAEKGVSSVIGIELIALGAFVLIIVGLILLMVFRTKKFLVRVGQRSGK